MPTIPFLSGLFGQPKDMKEYPVQKLPEEWQVKLTDDQMKVIRGKGTEAPYDGSYDNHMPSGGVYVRRRPSLA
jgi:hypothetical protein